MAFNGSDVRRLTNNGTDDVNPFWSPDGTRIVFEAYRDGQPEIYAMNADGSGQTRLTAFEGYDGQPVWSPDGQWIAFVSTRSDAVPRIYRMNPAGGQVQMVPTPGYATYPVWSPDGTMLAFSGDGNGDEWLEVWTVKVDGSEARQLYGGTPYWDHWTRSWVSWMPGDRVAFTKIEFIYYNGNWYWMNAYLNAYQFAPNADFYEGVVELAWAVDAGWHPDVISLDHTPPSFSLEALPPLQHYNLWLYLRELTDSGPAEAWGYEYGWQRYPDGPWIANNYLPGPYGFEISFDPPDNERYRARVRGWDTAGNGTGWRYTNWSRVYMNHLASRVADNRGLGVPDVSITTNYSTFLQLYDGEGVYHNYTAEEAPDWQSGEIRWSHDGFSPAGLAKYGGWADEGRFDFDVVLPPGDDVVVNGTFDSATLDGWEAAGPVMAAEWTNNAIFPAYVVEEMSLSQEISLPLAMTNPTLSFVYQLLQPADTPFRVELTSDSGTTVLALLANHTLPAEQRWVSLQPWAGETVTLRLVREAGANPPDVALDDVSVGSAYPDVWVSAVGQPVARRGATATLRLAYGNRSSLEAPETVVTYALPAALTLVEATPAPASTGPLRWELATLAPESGGTIELVVTVKDTATGGLASAPAIISTPEEAITGNDRAPLGVWVGGRVFLPGIVRE
jgi:hypothetical protein